MGSGTRSPSGERKDGLCFRRLFFRSLKHKPSFRLAATREAQRRRRFLRFRSWVAGVSRSVATEVSFAASERNSGAANKTSVATDRCCVVLPPAGEEARLRQILRHLERSVRAAREKTVDLFGDFSSGAVKINRLLGSQRRMRLNAGDSFFLSVPGLRGFRAQWQQSFHLRLRSGTQAPQTKPLLPLSAASLCFPLRGKRWAQAESCERWDAFLSAPAGQGGNSTGIIVAVDGLPVVRAVSM